MVAQSVLGQFQAFRRLKKNDSYAMNFEKFFACYKHYRRLESSKNNPNLHLKLEEFNLF